jgi:ubiquinone/menaquinone biosynthesis C-methylase UbiE
MDTSRTTTAFSLQSARYDQDDLTNPVLQAWRQRVYRHVEGLIGPGSSILELNAGTGIDALYFASRGYRVHATDASEGMIAQLERKLERTQGRVTAQKVGYEDLDLVEGTFDCIFSNFGGLNCIQNLNRVTRHLPRLMNPGGVVVWVIMPPVCPWEWAWVLKGSRKAFRRLSSGGTVALVEGEPFISYYHSLKAVAAALGPGFTYLSSEGLGAVSPPPAAYRFIRRFPRLASRLESLDQKIGRHFPFNRWADHLVLTFRRVA